MPDIVVKSQPAALAIQTFADAFGTVLDVVCKEFAPGPAPLTPEQLQAAAQIADEAWYRYCEAGGDAYATVHWVRERIRNNVAASRLN